MTLAEEIRGIAQKAKEASRILANLSSSTKNAALSAMADALLEARPEILKANALDLEEAKKAQLSSAMVDRLTLSDKRIQEMAGALRGIQNLPDPVGEITRMWRRPNGLLVGRMRIPLGVIGFIYESRPNVTSDAGGLCLKSGNSVILRGGSEALHSNIAIGGVLQGALERQGLPKEAIQVLSNPSRQLMEEMLKLEEWIDLVIPRGGESLIRFVVDHARMPVLKHYKGVCHVFVDASADLAMAERICFNSKVQRPGVCNAMETMLVHRDIAPRFLPPMAERFRAAGVELRGCAQSQSILPQIRQATEEDWYAEYLDLILAIRVVESLDAAIEHILRYGSSHTETIVTQSYENAQRFLREVPSSTVLVNASTRFSDGGELGLGAEIGISTTKLHAYGPMGLEELTTQKFIIYGNGQIRT